MLGAVSMEKTMNRTPKLNDAVALLQDIPASKLSRGQVGTVVDTLDNNKYLIEFSDDEGRAYAIEPLSAAHLLRLQYEPEAA
jgi:hypothetical protein